MGGCFFTAIVSGCQTMRPGSLTAFYRRKGVLRCGVLVVLGCLLGGAAEAGEQTRALIEEQFVRYDPDYHAHRKKYGARLAALGKRLAELEAQGRKLQCSKQIFLEAKWLHRYTAHWEDLVDKLDRLELSFEDRDQSFATRQLPTNGLWGACYEEGFLRIGATIDALGALFARGEKPRYRLRADGPLNTGKKLLIRLQDLLVSDIARSGVNNRGELSSLLTSISQGVIKPYIRDGLIEVLDLRSDSTLEHIGEAFRFFLVGAQDPETGYWGAWYLVDGKAYKTADLSMTYHIVSYTKGAVEHWPQIIATTIVVESQPYPYGWRHQGRYNNHNLYDVARIYKFGWPHMTETQRTTARAQLEAMLEWSLSNTVGPHGTFVHDPSFSDSLADEFYFGVSFLDMVGYWQPKRRFWRQGPDFEGAAALCCSISRRLRGLALDGWAAQGAEEKLERNCGSC
jgi:hypothetical protein